MDLLRFSTAGSVDDGKSTLIGRLLYDSKSIFEDQYEAIKRSSRIHGDGQVNLALLTDGLRAEREQGITIDVAYRYFATPKRKFIIADTPGHVQYTRNMVTGASTAELAIVLIDARNGVLTQSRRHGFIASLLQIPHLVVAVNKMDLVDYSQDRFEEVVGEYTDFVHRLDVENVVTIPISALKGDNVVTKSDAMAWYDGPTLLHHLETVKVGADRNVIDFRFPVQYVLRPHQDFRGFAGEVSSGTVRVGDEVMALPSRKTSRVKSIVTFEEEKSQAGPGEAVAITIEDEIDVSRGDMLVRMRNIPTASSTLDADICWMGEEPLQPNKLYNVMHTSHTAQAFVSKIIYRTDVDTLHRQSADSFSLNDIGRVELVTSEPLYFDSYRVNRHTGCFILIDPDTNTTVGAGMIRGVAKDVPAVGDDSRANLVSPNVVWEGLNIGRAEREAKNGHKAVVLWFTGLSGSGKSTIAREFERRLFDESRHTMLLDGDYVRHGLSGDLGFTPDDRAENIRRVGEVTRLFFEQGNIVMCTFVSPYRKDRAFVRSLIPDAQFIEVFVDADLAVCEARDPKGLYAKVREGEITSFTGFSAPYEEPLEPEITLKSDELSVEESVDVLFDELRKRKIIS